MRTAQWSAGVPAGAHRRGRRCSTLALCTALIIASAYSQPSRNSDLDRIRGEIAKLKSRLDDVHRQAQSAQQELEAVDLELGIRTRELALAVDMQLHLDEERRAIEAQIASLEPRIAHQKQDLAKRLVVLYRLGGLSYLRMFLAIDQKKDPLEAMSMLSFLVTRDAHSVSRFQTTRAQLTARRAELADREKQIEDTRRVVEERQRAVASAHAAKQRMLATLQREESGSEKQLAELEEKAKRLERLIDVLSKQQTSGVISEDVRGFQGALPWPVEGKVIERFGRQRNAKFNTFTTNNGVKIAAGPGVPVHAVFRGTVLFSQWFKGYGNLIVLDHGHRVFSLYGNLKSPTVAVGERIAAGQPIAGVGENGGESEEAPGGFLYFEIRQDNRPEDPQKWLR
jgi:septal ring factor EnvC (AmiA/AmiB activator)